MVNAKEEKKTSHKDKGREVPEGAGRAWMFKPGGQRLLWWNFVCVKP